MEKGLIGPLIKRQRQINEMTQQDVADRLGIDRTTYSKYENGKANPNFSNVIKMADIFGISVSEFSSCYESGSPIEFSDAGVLTCEEERLVYSFRSLSDRRQQEVLRVITRLSNDQAKEKSSK